MKRAPSIVCVLLALAALPVSGQGPGGRRIVLGNGMDALLLPDPTSRVVTSIVIVRSGSAWETARTSGASHFLEHMLFNGTERRTQQQLYDEVNFLGGFNNATTRRGETAFMLSLPSADLGRALDIQSDMLLHSTLPAESFEKERGIILEELAKDRDNQSYDLERILEAETFPECGWGLTVLGTESSIRSLTRDEVLRFYRENYVPERMLLVLAGGFEANAAADSLERYFGVERPAGIWPSAPPMPAPLTGARTTLRELPGGGSHLRIVWNAPAPESPDQLVTGAAAELMWGSDSSPLANHLQTRFPGAIRGCSAGLESGYGFGRLILDIDVAPGTALPELRDAVLAAIPTLAPPAMEALAAWKVAQRAELLYARQQSYMLATVCSEEVARRGTWGLQSLLDRTEALTLADVATAARGLGSGPSLTIRVEEPAAAAGPATNASGPPYAITDTTLACGARLLLLQGPSSGVVSVYLLFEGRNYLEPPGKGGLTEFLHNLWASSTPRRDAPALAEALDAIGAKLQTADDPGIPFDDRYTQPDFSFVRYQALEEAHAEAFALLGEILSGPRFDAVSIERVRESTLARLARQRTQSSVRARAQLSALLLGADHPEARSPYGDSAAVAGITESDLRAHRARLCDPRRIWIAVSVGYPKTKLLRDLQTMLETSGLSEYPAGDCAYERGALAQAAPELGRLAARNFASALSGREADPSIGAPVVTVTGGGAQSYVIEALLLSPADSLPAPGTPDEAGARIAAGVASSRIAFDVREKQGLAYGIGAGLTRIGDRWLYTAAAGTRPPGVTAVASGFVRGRRGAAADPDPNALAREANVLYGTVLRRQENRINQAMEAVLAVRAGKAPLAWWGDAERFRGAELPIAASALRAVARADSSLILIAR